MVHQLEDSACCAVGKRRCRPATGKTLRSGPSLLVPSPHFVSPSSSTSPLFSRLHNTLFARPRLRLAPSREQLLHESTTSGPASSSSSSLAKLSQQPRRPAAGAQPVPWPALSCGHESSLGLDSPQIHVASVARGRLTQTSFFATLRRHKPSLNHCEPSKTRATRLHHSAENLVAATSATSNRSPRTCDSRLSQWRAFPSTASSG